MDNRIIEHARAEELVILTRDTDFGQVLRHPEHPGALILRLPYTYTARQINERLETFLEEVDASELSGAIVIVERGRYRRRLLESSARSPRRCLRLTASFVDGASGARISSCAQAHLAYVSARAICQR